MRLLLIVLSGETSVEIGGLSLASFVGAYYTLRDAPADVVIASQRGGYPFLDTAAGEGTEAAAALQRYRTDRSAREDVADTLCLDDIHAPDFDGAMCLGQADGQVPSGLPNSCGLLISSLLASGKAVVIVPERLAPASASNGLLITGNRSRSPILGAHALIGALRSGDPGVCA
jgi:hypothetical protein